MEDFDAVVVSGGGDVITVRRPVDIVHVVARVVGTDVRPRAGVPNADEVVFRAGDNEFAVWRIGDPVVVAAGTRGEFVLIVRIADGPCIVEIGGTVAVSVGASVLVNRRSAR